MKFRLEYDSNSYIDIDTQERPDGAGFNEGAGVTESVGLKDDLDGNAAYNDAIDGLESLILSQACAGIDVTTPQYRQAFISAVDAIGNNYY